jgi:hypothetical protein
VAFALDRSLTHDQHDEQAYVIKDEEIIVTKHDFDRALGDIKPIFGTNLEVLEELTPECGFIKYNKELEGLMDVASEWISQAENSPVSPSPLPTFFPCCPSLPSLSLYILHSYSISGDLLPFCLPLAPLPPCLSSPLFR